MSKLNAQETQQRLLSAGARHGRRLCAFLIVPVLLAALMYAAENERGRAASMLMTAGGLLLGRWLFDALESIIMLLYIGCEQLRRTAENGDLRDSAPRGGGGAPSADRPAASPVTQEDPAHEPEQQPMDTGIDVAAALRAAESFNRK